MVFVVDGRVLSLIVIMEISYVWGYLKSRVYTHKPRILNDLRKPSVRKFVRSIFSCWPV